MSKLKMWDEHASWEAAEAAWDKGAAEAAQKRPLKGLRRLPQMIGITKETGKGLKRKSLSYMARHDKERRILRHFLRHPLRYSWNLVRSLLKRRAYCGKEGDFYLYGVNSVQAFEQELSRPNTLLALGFSYCHKPHECPSGRFTPECIRNPENPVCRQCFIGKALHAAPDCAVPLIIPTIHYIGDQLFRLIHQHPKKRILFLITACELTLEMFGDFGNMVAVKRLGVRLDGRICNTMRAFELSEEGTKPGLTVVLPQTQEKILALLRSARGASA